MTCLGYHLIMVQNWLHELLGTRIYTILSHPTNCGNLARAVILTHQQGQNVHR